MGLFAQYSLELSDFVLLRDLFGLNIVKLRNGLLHEGGSCSNGILDNGFGGENVKRLVWLHVFGVSEGGVVLVFGFVAFPRSFLLPQSSTGGYFSSLSVLRNILDFFVFIYAVFGVLFLPHFFTISLNALSHFWSVVAMAGGALCLCLVNESVRSDL